jgi:predicted ATPase
VIVVDDVQWLDPGSRRVLGHLSDSKESRVLYVLAGRDDAASWPALSRLLRSLDAERLWEVSLEPLDEEHLAELLRTYLHAEHADEDLVRHVSTLADGTPLGAIEVLRSLLDGGALLPHWGRWKFDATIASRLELPRGSVELLIRRTHVLAASTISTLTVAATIGMSFREELLAASSSVSPFELSASLAEGRQSLLIETTADGYRFVHDAAREAILAGVSPERLSEVHQRIAEALDREQREAVERSKSERPLLVRIHGGEGTSSDFELDLGSEEQEPRAAELVFTLATHYAEGELGRTPKRPAGRHTCVSNIRFGSRASLLRHVARSGTAVRHDAGS